MKQHNQVIPLRAVDRNMIRGGEYYNFNIMIESKDRGSGACLPRQCELFSIQIREYICSVLYGGFYMTF